MELLTKIAETADFIKQKINGINPKVAIILGSGLGPFAQQVVNPVIIPYQEIPNFQVPQVVGHAGQLVVGTIGQQAVLVQQGRWHFYEGYKMTEVVFPVWVYALLGIEILIITNAAGGINQTFQVSELMLLTDHLNLMGDNPLKGSVARALGEQFPDMSQVYDEQLIKTAQQVSQQMNLKLQQGVYAALTGPSYETPAEIKMLRILGADAVGMSTVPEAIAAHHRGLKVLGISCITNMAAGVTGEKLSHDEVKIAAKQSMQDFINLLQGIINQLS